MSLMRDTSTGAILLDEPAEVVNRILRASLLKRIHELQRLGNTILIVEYAMNVIISECNYLG